MAFSRKRPVKKPAKAKKTAPKVRKQKTVENDETCLQMHTASWLRNEYPALLAFHVANELKASVQYHIKLKRLGKLNGVADWLVFPPHGRKAAIELKDDKGVQDADQIKFQKRWEQSGGDYFLVRTVEDFQTTVRAIMLFG